MDKISEEFTDAFHKLEGVADAATPEEAAKTLDETTLQVFWRDWPHLSSWAGKLWRLLNEQLADPATPPQDEELDEVGGGG